jgi:hypothetical protein
MSGLNGTLRSAARLHHVAPVSPLHTVDVLLSPYLGCIARQAIMMEISTGKRRDRYQIFENVIDNVALLFCGVPTASFDTKY